MKQLHHPTQTLTRAKRAILFMVALVIGGVLQFALRQLNVPLETPEAPWGIVSFELSPTVENSEKIVGSWNVTARSNAQSGLLLDFIYPLCYSTVLTIGCFWAASVFHDRGFRKTSWLATFIAWLQWPAALFDYVENTSLLIQLRGPIQDPWPRIARDAASIKFALIIAGFCVIAGAAVVVVLRRRALPEGPPPADQVIASPPQVDVEIRPVP